MSIHSIFVIIVTYRGTQWYDHCFSSLRASNIPITTIVIDNASNDGSVEFIRSQYPEIVLIENDTNLGFGQANNIGLRYALEHGCDYVFLLNQDAWIEPDSIEKLVDIHLRNQEFGILSPMHLDTNKEHLNILVDDGAKNYELLSDFFCKKIKEIYPVQYVNAAAWLLPRKTLETVGGFDPIFLHYEEDDDYLNRVKFHKLKVGLCPQCIVTHDHSSLKNPLSSGDKRHQQFLLVDQTNINKPYHLPPYRIYLIRKVIVYLFTGKISLAREKWKDFRFLGRSKQQIILSRKTNEIIQKSWL